MCSVHSTSAFCGRFYSALRHTVLNVDVVHALQMLVFYYFTVIHSDRHFHLYSCRNQEESQLLAIRNLAIIQQSYTT